MSGKIQRGLSVAIAGILGSAAAHAEESRPSTVLEEIVVTAQKRQEKLQDVPIAITVVGQEQLENQHIYSITDLARTTPALEMIQAFGGPGGGGQIRGIGTTSFTRSAEGAVGVVLDGVPQGNVNTSNIFDMQRVEVLRGPQGTLFGLTSSAGVINMVTVAPDPSKFEAKLHLDYSDKDTAGSNFGQQTIRGVVNLPLGEKSALRISATGDKTTGVQYNETTNEDTVTKDYSVRARYRFKSSDDFEMNLIADYDKFTANYAAPSFNYVSAIPYLTTQLAACGITPSYANQERCPANPQADDNETYGASAQFDFGLGAHTLTSITAFRKRVAGPLSSDIMGLPSVYLNVVLPPGPENNTQIFSNGGTSAASQFSQEFRIASPAGQKLEYVAGLFYSDYEAKSGVIPGGAFNVRVYLILPPTFTPTIIAPVTSGTFTQTSNKSTAAFGQMTYHVTDSLGLIAGLRYTRQSITDQASGNIYAPVSPTNQPTFGDLDEDNISGRLGVTYKFSPNLSSYATAVRGYKGPQVSPASQGNPQTVIAAEIPMAFEVGVKGAFLDGRLGVDANVFHTDVQDYQGQRCRINSIGALACTPETVPSVVTKGVELSVYGQPMTGLSLNGGFIYDEAKYPTGWTGYNPNDLRDPVAGTMIGKTSLSDEQIVGVPETKFNLSADYTFSLGSLQGFVGADTVHKSDLRLGPTGDSRFIYPAHWTSGARLGVRSADDTWSITLFGRNLEDEHEPITLFGGPSFTAPHAGNPDPALAMGFVNGVSGWMTPAALRQIGLSVDLKF
jgi:iron complex outermembrane receptor protein